MFVNRISSIRPFAMMTTLFMVVIIVACSDRVSDSVAEVCEIIDRCTDEIAATETPNKAHAVMLHYDEMLRKYADDSTELTEADRNAILESLTKYEDEVSKVLIASIQTTNPNYDILVNEITKMKLRILRDIFEALDSAHSLGEFVTAFAEGL